MKNKSYRELIIYTTFGYMAVFTLEKDYSCETGYPFDDSRQIGNTSLIRKWNRFNFE